MGELRHLFAGLVGGGASSLSSIVLLRELSDFTTGEILLTTALGMSICGAISYGLALRSFDIYRHDPESRKQRVLESEGSDVWAESEDVDGRTVVKVYDTIYAEDEPAAYFTERDAAEWGEAVLDEVGSPEVAEA